jgi:hypothetical protein
LVSPLRGVFRASLLAGLAGVAQAATLHGNESEASLLDQLAMLRKESLTEL